VRIGHLSRAAVARAVKRAAVRAEARAARAELEARTPDVGSVLSMLAAVLGHEMNTPLSIATLSCEALNEGLHPMLDIQERLIGWATLAAPQQEFGRLMTALAQQPSPSELRAMLSDLRDGIGRATKVARLIRRLSTEEREPGRATVSAILGDLHLLLAGQVGQQAAIELEAQGSCRVQVGRPTLVLCLAALVAHAIEAVRALPRGEARIRLCASEHEDAVLVEIAHNGRAVPPDLRPAFLEPYFVRSSSRVVGELSVEGLQRRARLMGGELLVLCEGPTTTLRLVLPPADVELSANQLVEGAPDSRDRRTD
jgi:signal transduction histidine kinase